MRRTTVSDEFKVQWSVSLPPVAQYAKGHMFNFRADTAAELEALFDEVLASQTIQKALDVAALLTGAQVVTQTTAAPAPQPQQAQGATVTQHPAAAGLHTCEHGVREYRTGTSRKGPWAGWFCPAKVKNCSPEWEDD